MAGQVDGHAAVKEAEAARDRSLADVTAAARAEAIATADRIIDEAAAAGTPFSANDLRERFDIAQVPTPLRGARIRCALKNRHTIEIVNETVSTDRGTKGKRIFLYRGTALASGGAR